MRTLLLVTGVLALASSALAASSPLVDCTAGACPEIAIAGDRPAASPARGFADPTMRKDSRTRRIWMVYSWPHVTNTLGRPAVGVETHLAHSDDGGGTWTFDRKLWLAERTRDPRSGGAGLANSEAVALERGGGQWFSARDRYVIGSNGRLRASTYELRVATAASPRALADAREHAPRLSALSPQLSGCTFRDSALEFADGQLFLAAQCSHFTQGGEDFARGFVAVFATRPSGPVAGWRWRYVGQLADHGDAVELGGESLLQTELTRDRAGRLLAVFSPSADAPTSVLHTHFGCRVVEIVSLVPPRLRRSGGALSVVADVRASDQLPTGPGACTYEPASSTGVMIVRRSLAGGSPVVSLHPSRLRP